MKQFVYTKLSGLSSELEHVTSIETQFKLMRMELVGMFDDMKKFLDEQDAEVSKIYWDTLAFKSEEVKSEHYPDQIEHFLSFYVETDKELKLDVRSS